MCFTICAFPSPIVPFSTSLAARTAYVELKSFNR